MDLDIICALVVGGLVVAVASLVVSVKTMTLLINITRRKDVYICPGHISEKREGKRHQDHNSPRIASAVYECPDGSPYGRQYDSINNLNTELLRGDSRTNEKTIYHQADSQMNEPVYHEQIASSSQSTPLVRSTVVMRRSQTTIV